MPKKTRIDDQKQQVAEMKTITSPRAKPPCAKSSRAKAASLKVRQQEVRQRNLDRIKKAWARIQMLDDTPPIGGGDSPREVAAKCFYRKYAAFIASIKPQTKPMSFYKFVQAAWPIVEPAMAYLDNKHIQHICEHLEAVTDGKIRRLLINIPPGHGKSLLVSVLWPAWMWTFKPEWRLLAGSCGMDLAERDAMRCRQLMESDWYQKQFKPTWKLCRRVTGHRGNGVIIDDPLNAMDAYSDKRRNKANRWLDEAASNRLNDPRNGFVVIIMQRLHAGDMSGHVVEQKTYEHLCLPSRFEPKRRYQTSVGTDWRTKEGELLFPELFNSDVMDGEETRLGPLAFAGQHQQSPSPAAGNMFAAEMLCKTVDSDSKTYTFWPMRHLWDALADPATKRVCEAYLSFDTATKEKSQNDFTAGCLSVYTGDGYVYVAPLVLARMQIPEATRTVAKQWVKWKLVLGEALKGVRVEEGAGTAVVQYLRTLRNEAKLKEQTPNAGWTKEEWADFLRCDPVVPLPYQTRTERVGRTMEIVPFCSGMNVRLLEAPLSQTWLSGLMGFPNVVHDDETQSFYAAVDPFVTTLEGKPVVTKSEWKAAMQTLEEMD